MLLRCMCVYCVLGHNIGQSEIAQISALENQFQMLVPAKLKVKQIYVSLSTVLNSLFV